jgi:acyl transferase domain-containing protein
MRHLRMELVLQVQRLTEQWREEGVDVRAVATDVPFHTPLLEKLAGYSASRNTSDRGSDSEVE